MSDGRATSTRVQRFAVSEREKDLRRKLPDLHVGRSRTGIYHILDARHQEPLCYVGQQAEVEDDGPLEHASPGYLCAHCARKQGDEYGEW